MNVDGRMAYAARQLGGATYHFSDENFPSNGHLLSLMTSYIHGLLGILEISLYAHTAKVNSNLFQDQGMGHLEHKCLMSSMLVIKET